MKRKLVQIALAVLCVLTLSLAIAGCSGGKGGKKYDYLVTFDYNVGTLQGESGSDKYIKYLGVKENSLLVIWPGHEKFSGESIQGYYVAGWYLPQVDENGDPVVGEDKRVLLSEEWNFDERRVTQNVTLYAYLRPNSKLSIAGGDSDVTFDTSQFKNGMDRPESILAPKKAGYTLVDYYEDQACTKKFTWPYHFDEEEKTIYAKFIEGDWAAVITGSDFVSALTAVGNNKKPIYLDNDIDLTGVNWSANIAFSLEINGNGHSVKNVSFTKEASKADNSLSQRRFALFGNLDGAYVHDITFENVSLTYHKKGMMEADALGPNRDIYHQVAPFAISVSAETRLSNVVLTGKLEIIKDRDIFRIDVFEKCINEADVDSALLAGIDLTGFTVSGND